MNVLAIDPGVTMGYARHVQGQAVEAGLKVWETKKGEQPGIRLANFRNWLVGKTLLDPRHEEPDRIDLIILEAPLVHGRQKSGPANRLAYAWSNIAEEVAVNYGTQFLEVANNTIKKFATGNGAAEKELVLLEALKKWPHLFPEEIHDLTMIGTKILQVGTGRKKTVGIWSHEPDPKLFEISDALWILQWAREEVEING